MTAIRLSKLHATGNDFLVLSTIGPNSVELHINSAKARALCDRHTGIGADGLIIISPGANGSDATMVLYNADGGIAEMSGNGMRTLAWAAARDGLGQDGTLVVDTGGGRRQVELTRDPATNEVTHVIVDMGPVTFDPAQIPVALSMHFDVVSS